MVTRALLFAVPLCAAAAPIQLAPPQAGDFSAATVKPCGDLATPCAAAPLGQTNQSQASIGWTAPPSPGWTYGGSVSTGIAGGSHLRGPATAVAGSLWARSPDGQWTVAVGVSHQSFPGYGYGYGAVGPGFGQPR